MADHVTKAAKKATKASGLFSSAIKALEEANTALATGITADRDDIREIRAETEREVGRLEQRIAQAQSQATANDSAIKALKTLVPSS